MLSDDAYFRITVSMRKETVNFIESLAERTYQQAGKVANLKKNAVEFMNEEDFEFLV